MFLAAELLQAVRAHAFGQRRSAQRSFGAFGFAVEETHC